MWRIRCTLLAKSTNSLKPYKLFFSFLSFLITLNLVRNLYKLTPSFPTVLEELICEKWQKHIFTTFILYLVKTHFPHCRACLPTPDFTKQQSYVIFTPRSL